MFGNTKTIVSIDLKGVIASGARAQLNNDALSSIFLKLEKIKCDAISININSPGGSPVQSSLIGNKIRSIASKKKLKFMLLLKMLLHQEDTGWHVRQIKFTQMIILY